MELVEDAEVHPIMAKTVQVIKTSATDGHICHSRRPWLYRLCCQEREDGGAGKNRSSSTIIELGEDVERCHLLDVGFQCGLAPQSQHPHQVIDWLSQPVVVDCRAGSKTSRCERWLGDEPQPSQQ